VSHSWQHMPQNSSMAGKTRTLFTSRECLEAQIRALLDGMAQGAAYEAAVGGWINGGRHPGPVKGAGCEKWPERADLASVRPGHPTRVAR
jgi:hypothetical protein